MDKRISGAEGTGAGVMVKGSGCVRAGPAGREGVSLSRELAKGGWTAPRKGGRNEG